MSDAQAEGIAVRIRDYHRLNGFIAETMFDAPGSTTIVGTTGNGDGAIWSGTYLAAEAFHYAVTNTADAWTYLSDALQRVTDLATIVPNEFLVRTLFPCSSPFFSQFKASEEHSGLHEVVYNGETCFYPGHPTRDQYAGVLFGLGIAHDIVDAPTVKATCADTITHLVDRLIASNWTMTSSQPHFSENYNIRPDQYLSVLQLARHVNPDRFTDVYEKARPLRSVTAKFPLIGDILLVKIVPKNYSLLNLDYLYYYWLVKYETDAKYAKRYQSLFKRLRDATKNHRNAHFNMIDFVLNGSDPQREAETVGLLEELFGRGFTDNFVGSPTTTSKQPLPVADRPYEDFLWQRSPFRIKEPGPGTKESPGIDYILPYWMARYYGILSE